MALALMSVIISGALVATWQIERWTLNASLSHLALNQIIEEIQLSSESTALDFYAVDDFDVHVQADLRALPATASECQLVACFSKQRIVHDISSCARSINFQRTWRSNGGATSSIELSSSFIQYEDVIARGGDCVTRAFPSSWGKGQIDVVATVVAAAQFTTAIDSVGDYAYVVASSSPQVRIYKRTDNNNLALVGVTSGDGRRINALDVVRDIPSGRVYAYVMYHSSTSQLGVFDVTDPTAPQLLTTRSLGGANPAGSFPQGWRVLIYGDRLYALTRETMGQELHVFSLTNPETPTELVSGRFELSRTVNDLAVMERLVGGVVRRYLILAASSNLKEVSVVDVTSGVPREVSAINLPGNSNALSLHSDGKMVYVGREAVTGGPELYKFLLTDMVAGIYRVIASSEVGSPVGSLRGVGEFLFLSVTKLPSEVQIWSTDVRLWSTTTQNSARLSRYVQPGLVPAALDNGAGSVYVLTQSAIAPELVIALQPL